MSTQIYTSKEVGLPFSRNVFTKNEGGAFPSGKYEAQLVIPKSDVVTMAALTSAIAHETAKYLADNKLKTLPESFRKPYQDGDVAYAADAQKVADGELNSKSEPYDADWLAKQLYKKGSYLMTAKSANPPKIVDVHNVKVLEIMPFSTGQFCLSIYGYHVSKVGNGITAGFEGAMIVQNGSRPDITAGFDTEGDEEAFA